MKKLFQRVIVISLLLIVTTGFGGAWSNLGYSSIEGQNFHRDLFGNSGHYKYQSDSKYSANQIGHFYNYGTHDYILDKSLFYLATGDFQTLTVIESHRDWDLALAHTDNPDYDYANFDDHYYQINDQLGAKWAGYPDGKDIFAARGGLHYIKGMLRIYITSAQLYRQTGQLHYKEDALTALGALSHAMGDLSNPLHTTNLIVYNPTGKKWGKKIVTGGVGGPLWWNYPVGDKNYSLHYWYEYTTSHYPIMNAVNEHLAGSYQAEEVGESLDNFLIDYVTIINQGQPYDYPTPRADFSIFIGKENDIYDSHFPVELRKQGVTYGKDGYETTPNMGAQSRELITRLYYNLKNKKSYLEQPGYDPQILKITSRVIEEGVYRLTDLLSYAEEKIRRNDYTRPAVNIVGWRKLGTEEVDGISDQQMVKAPYTGDLIAISQSKDPLTVKWAINGQTIGTGQDLAGAHILSDYSFQKRGDYLITIEVKNEDGQVSSDSIILYVR